MPQKYCVYCCRVPVAPHSQAVLARNDSLTCSPDHEQKRLEAVQKLTEILSYWTNYVAEMAEREDLNEDIKQILISDANGILWQSRLQEAILTGRMPVSTKARTAAQCSNWLMTGKLGPA